MTADEVHQLARAGWELGAHTLTHADLSKLDYEDCMREIEGSCRALREITGVPVQTLAYPYGRYGPEAIAATRDVGLIAAVTTGSGGWEPYELTRAMIGAADPYPIVLLKLTDRYEPLLSSPPLRAVRQASKLVRHRLGDQPGGAEAPGPS
jgi:peptidoglycan/xylan/chitin deacetylase (PgdA/CDA1 family)